MRTNNLFIYSILALLIPPMVSAGDTQETPDKKIPAEIMHCHDGDTCRVVTDSGLWFNARLAGIDAPEVGRYGKTQSEGQPMGAQSRDSLVDLVVKKKNISVRQVDLDPYNRPVIEIYAGEDCINMKLLELGMAERYRGKTKRIDKEKYDASEAKAKSNKVGIWSVKNYVSPQDWRREGKK